MCLLDKEGARGQFKARSATWKLVPPTVRSVSMPARMPAASAAPQRPRRLGVEAESLKSEMATVQGGGGGGRDIMQRL